MSDSVIFYKFLIAVLLLLINFFFFTLILSGKILITSKKNYLFLLLSRILLFFIVFVILSIEAQSDVKGYYFAQASNILNGMIPYVDFPSSYSFFFPYICAVAILIWNSAKSIILLSILIEMLTFYAWQTVFLKIERNNKNTLISALFYLINPMPILLIVISGQNQIWLSLFLASSIIMMIKKRYFLAGFVFSIGFLVTKFLILFFLPILIIFAKEKLSFTKGFAIPCILYFTLSVIVGFDIFTPLYAEADNLTSGNLYYLLSIFNFTISSILIWDIVVLITILGLFVLIWKKYNVGDSLTLITTIVIIFILFLLINKKSYTNYLVIIFQPLTYLYFLNNITKSKIFSFWLFSTVAAIEPTLWFRLMNNYDLSIIWDFERYNINLISIVSFLIIELILIFYYPYLVYSLTKTKLFRK